MNVAEFQARWRRAALTERAGSQSHFNDLCRLMGHPTPTEADPEGRFVAFEQGVGKTGGADFADVWSRRRLTWGYKKPGEDLEAAYRQRTCIAASLSRRRPAPVPRLHSVCGACSPCGARAPGGGASGHPGRADSGRVAAGGTRPAGARAAAEVRVAPAPNVMPRWWPAGASRLAPGRTSAQSWSGADFAAQPPRRLARRDKGVLGPVTGASGCRLTGG